MWPKWRTLAPPRLPLFFVLTLTGAVIVGSPSASQTTHYESGFPSDTRFFPIGAWLQSPRNALKYRAIGINTFVGLWKGPTEAQLAELSRNGMYVVAGQNEVALYSPNRRIIKGWMQADEPDNAQPPVFGLGRYSPCIPAAEVARRSHAIKARDPTRPVLINFGRGVADPSWHGRGTCTGDVKYYDVAVEGADIVSFDIYPVGSDTPNVKGKLEYVAKGVTNLAKRILPGQNVWTVIETTALDPARPVKPVEVRAEVWMALIHGARGIVYFVHEWAGGLREDGIFQHPEIVAEVARINQTIVSLAPALNGADLPNRIDVMSPVPIANMAKQHGGDLYVFAVAMQDRPSRPRLKVRGIREADAVVLNEGRRIAIKEGVIEDDFDGYAVHLYRIPLPSGDTIAPP
jgi:hypothetical protein